MKNKFCYFFLLLFSAVLFINVLAIAHEIESIPGQYIVKFKKGKSYSALEASDLLQTKILQVLSDHNAVLIERGSIEFQDSAMQSLLRHSAVEWVEPNVIYRIEKIPNDPQWPNLWGLHSANGYDISADRAWDISTGSQDTVVAVVDTGVDYNSPEFNGNIWANKKELMGQPGVDDDGNGMLRLRNSGLQEVERLIEETAETSDRT